MSFEPETKRLFHYIKFICGGVCAVMMLWLCLTLFFPSIGGAFPFRTRGPLAKYDYYKLGDFEDWESVLEDPVTPPDPDHPGRIVAEQFMADGEIGELNFGDPNDTSRIDPDIEEARGVNDDIKNATQP
ncbi:MAG: hypothetical protein P9L94_17415 [Candidatus Hinthialibacter antarcticus]|nr:hypothetical protein [Candidatus Hinthialibacter antarcticus]